LDSKILKGSEVKGHQVSVKFLVVARIGTAVLTAVMRHDAAAGAGVVSPGPGIL